MTLLERILRRLREAFGGAAPDLQRQINDLSGRIGNLEEFAFGRRQRVAIRA